MTSVFPLPRLLLRNFSRQISLVAAIGLTGLACADGPFPAQWPQFRGEMGSAVGTGKPPVAFGASSNRLWQVDAPAGNSSPIIWGDHLFITGLEGSSLSTLAYDRQTGRLRWRHSVTAAKLEATHRLANPATPSAVTDGQRVFAYFGSYGVVAYDFDGHEVWHRELPTPVVEFGTSASPIIVGDLLILARDQDTGSHLLALRKNRVRSPGGWNVRSFGAVLPRLSCGNMTVRKS